MAESARKYTPHAAGNSQVVSTEFQGAVVLPGYELGSQCGAVHQHHGATCVTCGIGTHLEISGLMVLLLAEYHGASTFLEQSAGAADGAVDGCCAV